MLILLPEAIAVRKYDVPGYDRRGGGNLSEFHHALTIEEIKQFKQERRHEQIS